MLRAATLLLVLLKQGKTYPCVKQSAKRRCIPTACWLIRASTPFAWNNCPMIFRVESLGRSTPWQSHHSLDQNVMRQFSSIMSRQRNSIKVASTTGGTVRAVRNSTLPNERRRRLASPMRSEGDHAGFFMAKADRNLPSNAHNGPDCVYCVNKRTSKHVTNHVDASTAPRCARSGADRKDKFLLLSALREASSGRTAERDDCDVQFRTTGHHHRQSCVCAHDCEDLQLEVKAAANAPRKATGCKPATQN